MFHRPNPDRPWLNVAAAFALGATFTWLAALALERLRRTPLPLGDDVVLERVRARVGEIVSDPRAVHVTVENGIVRLSGQVAPEERDELLTQLLYMPGVVRLRNALALSS
jgi:isopentenyl diphosphate isomerase/L-lactate dehydrogenase-like FMN-dependent dehydrogenase